MDSEPLQDRDAALIERARDTCEASFDPTRFDGAHVVAAALRTEDGRVYDGVSLPASIGRASVCAEPVAVGTAISDGVDPSAFDAIVAVSYPLPEHDADDVSVIPPCGVCRELLADYRESMAVIVPEGDEARPVGDRDALAKVPAADLLPNRTW